MSMKGEMILRAGRLGIPDGISFTRDKWLEVGETIITCWQLKAFGETCVQKCRQQRFETALRQESRTGQLCKLQNKVKIKARTTTQSSLGRDRNSGVWKDANLGKSFGVSLQAVPWAQKVICNDRVDNDNDNDNTR